MASHQEREGAFRSLQEKFNQKDYDFLRAESIPGLVGSLKKLGFYQLTSYDYYQEASDSFDQVVAQCKKFSAWSQCFGYMLKVARSAAFEACRPRRHERAMSEGFEAIDRESEQVFDRIDLADAFASLHLKNRDFRILKSMAVKEPGAKILAARFRMSIASFKLCRSSLRARLKERLKEFRDEQL